MSKKLIACVAVFAALIATTAWAAWPAPKVTGCCYPGAECCYPSSPCCGHDCCYEGSPCCYPGSPCCGEDCCVEGAACCAEGSACCSELFTSADAPKAVSASPAANVTVIAVEDMECPSCAKKIVAKLQAVAGVAKVVADTETSKLSITPKEKASPSPKAMWLAIEKAGYKPTRLEGPSGKFTALPKE